MCVEGGGGGRGNILGQFSDALLMMGVLSFQQFMSEVIGPDARHSDFLACQRQRCRPACTSMQLDRCLCYSLPEKY